MCLAVPGKIVEMYQNGPLTMGKMDYGGIVKEACLAYLPEAKVGDYAIVHAGFAISLLSEEEAQATLETLREIEALDETNGNE